MPEKLRIKKAFCFRLMTALLAALFVIPAYLFFSDPPQDAMSQIEMDQPLPENSPISNDAADISKPESKSSDWHNADVREQTVSAVDKESVSTLLSQLLADYQSFESEPDQKRAIRAVLPDINATAEGRALIASFFFHDQEPEKAAAMYDMILDARLKDATLIAELIERDEREYRLDYKIRLIDLIADHNTIEQSHNQKIEDFLADMARHSDESVRLAATSQWAAYVLHHKGIQPVMNAYLFNHSSQARQEIYEMIETGRIKHESDKTDLAVALDSLLYADYLDLDANEKTHILKLKAQLYP